MRLAVERIELDDGTVWTAAPAGGALGAHEATIAVVDDAEGSTWSWSLARAAAGSGAVRSVAIVFRVVDVVGSIRMLRHGYQSWSPSDVAVFGRDRDRSLVPGSVDLIRAINQADQRVVTHDDELRSEWVTVLVDDTAEPIVVGFDGGERHDGTLRLRTGATGVELCCEAFLGDAVLVAGEQRTLHALTISTGAPADELLARWATAVGARADARVDAAHQVGWCSWYHYFHGVTRADIDANLALADDWPFDVFQLDDGYQAAIGDWTILRDTFASSLDGIADAIRATGTTAGLWLAPFLASPDSEYARRHPDHFARAEDGDPLYAMFNPIWGGFVWGLDPTNPATAASLTDLGRTVRDAGYDYVKLDFTFSPNVPGVYHDPTRTPAERVRAGYDAFRAGFGDDGFVLGCGAPLGAAVGAVEAMRIGPDVAPAWDLRESGPAGYEFGSPATRHALEATHARQFMHRRFWVNDPDCVMLRTTDTDLTPEQSRTWAHAVGDSGGMVIVSDDLALLGPEHRTLLDDVIAAGRAADAATIAELG